MLKKGNWHERGPVTDQCHDRSEKPDKRVDKKLRQNSSERRSSDARQLGCVFQDMTPPKSILRKCTDMQKPIQRVKFTKAIARHTKIRDQNPSLGYNCPGEPHDLGIKEGLVFYQTRSNAIILQGTLPAHCISNVERLKTGEMLYERRYLSPRPPPKISLRHDHDWTRGNDELGSTVEQRPVGKLVRQFCGEVQHEAFSQLTQTKPKPICDRSGQPDSTEDVFVVKGETSRSHEIDEKGFHGELGSSDRSGKSDYLSENTCVEQTRDGSGQPDERNSSSAHTVKEQFAPEENRDIASFNTDNEFNRAINEEDIDFNIPGLPHSAVKRSHGVNVQNFDSEDREPPSSTCTSKRSSTTSTIQSLQLRITRHG